MATTRPLEELEDACVVEAELEPVEVGIEDDDEEAVVKGSARRFRSSAEPSTVH